MILSYGLWARRYGGDPAIVGRSIRLDGQDQTVVGVMPKDFRLWLPSEAFLITDSQIWKPLQYNYANQPPRNYTFFTVFGRLKPGVTFAQAQAEMSGIARQLRAENPVLEDGDMRVRVVPLQDDVVKHARRAIVSLFVAVGFVLLIACANVAHLLLARATAREREMAVRGALGATRARLLRQLATESLVLAAGGCAVGLIVARAGTQTLALLHPANLPKLEAIQIDGTALLFAAGASVLTAIVFGLMPAFRAAGINLNRTLRATGSASGAQVRLRGILMIGEMALALVLLIGAGLMIRSFAALQQVRPGFDPAGVLTFRMALPIAKYPNAPARLALLRQTEEQIRAIPGVTEVGFTSQLPLTGSGPLSPYAYNEATARNWESETSDGRSVSPGVLPRHGHAGHGRPRVRRARHAAAEHHRHRRNARGPRLARRERRRQAAAGRTQRDAQQFLRGHRRRRAHPRARSVAPGAPADLPAVRRRRPARRRDSRLGRPVVTRVAGRSRDEAARSRHAARPSPADVGLRGRRARADAAEPDRDDLLRGLRAAAVVRRASTACSRTPSASARGRSGSAWRSARIRAASGTRCWRRACG